MIRIGICDDLVEQLQIQEEMVRNIVCRLGLNTEIKCFQSGEDLLWEMEQKAIWISFFWILKWAG